MNTTKPSNPSIQKIDDTRIAGIHELAPPAHLMREFDASDTVQNTVAASRHAISQILQGRDDRLLVIIGPCSIHDPKAALEYRDRLLAQRHLHANELEIVMRVYFEKPRTTVGWKGLINDPDLNNTFDINKGLRVARELLVNINATGMPAATEFLDVISPQYIADLVAWGAIGARTTESQIHRELASGLSCPVGFKNGTDGNIKIASDAVKAAAHPHHFLSVTKGGVSAIVETNGNTDCHIILRGGKTPNYDASHVQAACAELQKAKLPQSVMIDCSHANSSKLHDNQMIVAADIAAQLAAGENRIMGVMVESNLVAGRQDLQGDTGLETLTYGQSVTDACIDWAQSVELLNTLAQGVQSKRLKAQ